MPTCGKSAMVVLVVCLLASMAIGDRPPRDDADRNPRRRLSRPATRTQCPAVSITAAQRPRRRRRRCSLASWLGPMAPTPPPRRCARRSSWPSSPAPSSTSSAPSSRSRDAGSQAEQGGAPADVQYEIGPREDVNLVLDSAAAAAQGTGSRVADPPGRGRPRRRDPQRRRRDQGRPDRRRQQGDDRRPPLPARQRPQQRLPSRALQRDHRPHDLAARLRFPLDAGVGRARPASIRPAPCSDPWQAEVAGGRLQPASATCQRRRAPAARTPLARTIAATPETWAAAIEVPT